MSRIVVAATQISKLLQPPVQSSPISPGFPYNTPYTTWACAVLVKVNLDEWGRSDVFAQSARDRIEPGCATVKPLTGGSKVVGLAFGSGSSACQRHIRHRQQRTQPCHMILSGQKTGSLPTVLLTSIDSFVVVLRGLERVNFGDVLLERHYA